MINKAVSRKVLAMDTTFAQGSVALLLEQQVVAYSYFSGEGGHIDQLPVETARLLAEAGWCGQDLDLLAVTVGPGSFTGSRIALALAKGFSLAVGVPVIGVSTLELLVASVAAKTSCKRVAALLDARRQEVYAALYESHSGNALVELLPPSVWDPVFLAQELADHWSTPDEKIVLVGNGLAPYGQIFQQSVNQSFVMSDARFWQLDARQLGLLALQRMNHSNGLSIEGLEPLYLRRADARKMVVASP